jgi:acyl-CoA reductase-like NAD-dependent aldehyde dehydrogenase
MTSAPADPQVPAALAMLERATWAARAFARYDKESVDQIVRAVGKTALEHAEEYADRAVRETGFGVAEHKVIKNIACSRGIVDAYRDHDYVTPRIDAAAKVVRVPLPAGVVLALTPSTNPVCTVYFKVLLALMTRNAVVISPHPAAKRVCAAAANALAEAATAAGAPDGVVQAVEETTIPLINALMADRRTSVIVATGGTAMVRSAYRSGNPALGVGPANVPVLVDATADLAKAATRIVDSKAFDNSILCTNESVLIAEDQIADRLLGLMKRAGAHPLTEPERDRVRDAVFPDGRFDTAFVGKDAAWIAQRAGVRVDPGTRVLLAPFELAVPEEPLAHEKLCPVLGFVRAPSARRGIDVARALLRIGGAGHSAAIHSADPRTVLAYSTEVPVLRVSVNVGNSLGSAGLETNLAPSMTIGTGYFGRSSVGANLEPEHLVNWSRIAYNADDAEPFGDFTGLDPWRAPAGPVPAYPHASNRDAPAANPPAPSPAGADTAADTGELRERLRQLIMEELAEMIKG